MTKEEILDLKDDAEEKELKKFHKWWNNLNLDENETQKI